MSDKLASLDKNNATLRLLYILCYDCPASPRIELMEISKTYGIGSSAFYKSLKTLKQLNLVKEDKKRKKTITTLTDKGYQVAKKISEINDILNTRP